MPQLTAGLKHKGKPELENKDLGVVSKQMVGETTEVNGSAYGKQCINEMKRAENRISENTII